MSRPIIYVLALVALCGVAYADSATDRADRLNRIIDTLTKSAEIHQLQQSIEGASSPILIGIYGLKDDYVAEFVIGSSVVTLRKGDRLGTCCTVTSISEHGVEFMDRTALTGSSRKHIGLGDINGETGK